MRMTSIVPHGRIVVATGLMALLMAACGEPGVRDPAPTRPFFSGGGAEGGVTADIQVEMTEKVDGNTSWYELTDTTGVYAPLVDGWAFADTAVLVPSALGVTAEGYQWSGEARSGADTVTDSLSNVHVVSYYAPAGTPPSHMQHFINGQLVTDQTILWVADDGDWVMTETVWEYYEDGDTLTIWSSASGEMATGGVPGVDFLRGLAFPPIPFLRPQPLQAQLLECSAEWANWFAASFATAAAWGFYQKQKNPLTRLAFASAVAWAGSAFTQLVNCMVDADAE